VGFSGTPGLEISFPRTSIVKILWGKMPPDPPTGNPLWWYVSQTPFSKIRTYPRLVDNIEHCHRSRRCETPLPLFGKKLMKKALPVGNIKGSLE